MRVFRRAGELRTPDEGAFHPARIRRGSGAAIPSGDGATGFEDNAAAVRFGDVAGLDAVVDDLRDVVGYLAGPGRYESLGARPPTGILLFGEPGCGKTLLGRALAGEVGVPFYFVSATSFVERFVGLGASRIRELFATAAQDSPCVVFIDELDAVGRRRTDAAGDREFDHTLNQLLVELDGFLGARGVITIGATNRPELLDAALIRPGRFDRRIEVPRPDRDGRHAVLRLHASDRPCAPDVDWAKVAEATDGCSPAELAGLVNEAALLAARDRVDVVGRDHVASALDRLVGGGIRSVAGEGSTLDRRAAHEAGHVLVALRLSSAMPRARVSITSCGPGAPAGAWSSAARRAVSTGPELTAELVILMGGRAGEELLLGSPSTLSEADLAAAGELARRIERAELGVPGVPGPAGELRAWAEREATRIVRDEVDAAAAIAAAVRVHGAMFVDEIRALVPPRPRGDLAG